MTGTTISIDHFIFRLSLHNHQTTRNIVHCLALDTTHNVHRSTER